VEINIYKQKYKQKYFAHLSRSKYNSFNFVYKLVI